MGCCISSNKKFALRPKPRVMLEPVSNYRANIAPPPCLEEETVKEVVLSETPLPTPQHQPKDNTTQMPILQERNNEAKDLNLNINEHEQEGGGEEEEISQVSQVSEIYSISESFSTTTTTTTVALTEIKDDEAVSKETGRELNYRSHAKVPRKAKRADSSRVPPRPISERTVPRNVGPTGLRRENGGGSSSRRLKSRATGTAGGVGRSRPGKATTGSAGGKLREENEGKQKVNGDVLMEKSKLNESLYNPHVSMECFIFL